MQNRSEEKERAAPFKRNDELERLLASLND